MSTDFGLRDRLIAALHAADCGCDDTPTHWGAQYTPQGDAALAVFSEWLRTRGNQLEPVLYSPSILLQALANEVAAAAEGEQG